jgi:hypothetical protein
MHQNYLSELSCSSGNIAQLAKALEFDKLGCRAVRYWKFVSAHFSTELRSKVSRFKCCLGRKILTVALTFCFLLLSWILSPQCSIAAENSQWRIVQWHHKAGKHEILICPTAVKIEDKTAGFALLSKAPKWEVQAFRQDDKVVCTMPRSLYYAKQDFSITVPRMHGFEDIGTQTICGMNARAFHTPKVDIYTVKLPSVSAPVEDLIIAYYEMRTFEGVALKVTKTLRAFSKNRDISLFSRSSPGLEVVLETKEIKRMPFNASDFVLPRRLRHIDALEQVKTSAARRKEGDEIFSDLKLGEKLGKRERK